MSDRDRQLKHNKENIISSSMYARVNTGQNANNEFDGVKGIHIGGSMNNPDERVAHYQSLLQTVLFYLFTGIFSFIYIMLGLWGFQDYFYNGGLNQILPSLILLIVSIALGIFSTNGLLKIVHKMKK